MYVESLPTFDARNHPACIILFCMYTYKVEIPWASWLIVLSLLKLLFIFSCAIRNFGFRKKWKHRMNSVCQQNSAFSAFSFGSHLINVIHFKSTQIPFLRAYVLSQYRVSLEFYLDRILRIFDIFFLPFSFTAKLYEPQLYPHISFVCFNHSVQYWYSSSPVITFFPMLAHSLCIMAGLVWIACHMTIVTLFPTGGSQKVLPQDKPQNRLNPSAPNSFHPTPRFYPCRILPSPPFKMGTLFVINTCISQNRSPFRKWYITVWNGQSVSRK